LLSDAGHRLCDNNPDHGVPHVESHTATDSLPNTTSNATANTASHSSPIATKAHSCTITVRPGGPLELRHRC